MKTQAQREGSPPWLTVDIHGGHKVRGDRQRGSRRGSINGDRRRRRRGNRLIRLPRRRLCARGLCIAHSLNTMQVQSAVRMSRANQRLRTAIFRGRAAQSQSLGSAPDSLACLQAAKRRGANGPRAFHRFNPRPLRQLNSPSSYVGGTATCVARLPRGRRPTSARWVSSGLGSARAFATAPSNGARMDLTVSHLVMAVTALW